jgi:hypothetical protein
MPTSPVIVRVGFDLSAIGDPTLFTLDDPVQGELDSSFVLGGTLFQDVTPYVRSVTVRRGRSRRLDKYQAGTAGIVFDNSDRRFDPVYAGSPYAGQIKPRRPVTIEVGSEYLFTGLVEDWNLDYSLSGDSIATAACVDGFVLLAGAELESFTNTAELPGDRIAAVLDRPEVSWPTGARDIAEGSQALQADTVNDGTGVLSYLQLVEETENGSLFVASDGVLTFKAANTPSSEISDLVFTNLNESSGDSAYDAPVPYDALDIPYDGVDPIVGDFVLYSGIGVEYGTETLYNRAIVTRANSSTVVTADDLPSQAEFGVTALDRQGLLFASDDQLAPVAEYLVNRYGTPQVRIRNVTVNAHGLSAALRSRVLGLDFGDVVRVRFTPNNIGSPIDQYLTVEGVSHSISPVTHQVSFDMELITYFPFELDSIDYGILDDNVLGL